MAEIPEQLKKVSLDQIFWNQPIREFTREDVKNMGASLRIHGQIEPIICDAPDEEGLYEGVCGRLRYEGARYAKIPEVLVRVYSFKSESEKKAWQLAENLHRKEITALQRAEAYRQLKTLYEEEQGGKYGKQIVTGISEGIEKLTGEKPSERTVWKYIQIAEELPEQAKKRLKSVPGDTFGAKHAEQLLRLKEAPGRQAELVEEIEAFALQGKPLSVRDLRKKVDGVLNPQSPEPKTFKCQACMDEYQEPEKPVNVTLCRQCEMEFRFWKAERQLEG